MNHDGYYKIVIFSPLYPPKYRSTYLSNVKKDDEFELDFEIIKCIDDYCNYMIENEICDDTLESSIKLIDSIKYEVTYLGKHGFKNED